MKVFIFSIAILCGALQINQANAQDGDLAKRLTAVENRVTALENSGGGAQCSSFVCTGYCSFREKENGTHVKGQYILSTGTPRSQAYINLVRQCDEAAKQAGFPASFIYDEKIQKHATVKDDCLCDL
jgi:hypothetical protein